MKTMYKWFTLLILCLLVGNAYAQESERGQLWEVQTLEVMPGDIPAFQEIAAEIVAASGMANMSADYGWYFWSYDNHFVLSSPAESMADYDDPGDWMRQFAENEEAQKKVQAAFQRMEKDVQVRPLRREVLEEVTGWVYEAENAPETGGGMLYTFREKPGEYEAFNAVMDDYAKFWGKINYPYDVYAYRPMMGEVGVTHVLIPYDNRSMFYGENSIEGVAERAGMSDMNNELLGRLMQSVESWESQDMTFHLDMSYTGPSTGSN